MRLTKLRPQVRSPSERERRRLSIGKVVYFGILAAVALVLLRLGFRKLWYVEGNGFVRGTSALVQTVDRGRILWSGVEVGATVSPGQVLARIGRDEAASAAPPPSPPDARAEWQAEVRRLEARVRDEVRDARERLDKEIQGLEDRIADRERRLAERRTEAEAAALRREAQEAEAARWRRLFELEAIPLGEYLRRTAAPPPVPSADPVVSALEEELARLREQLREVRGRRPRASAETLARLAEARRRAQAEPAPPGPSPEPGGGDTPLRAPIGGVVGEVFRRTGEVLLEGEPLARIVDPGSVYVEAWFPPEHQARLKPGTPVTLVFVSGETGAGTVEHVDPTVTDVPAEYQKRYEPLQRAVRVRVRPADPVRYAGALDAKVWVRVTRFLPGE